MQAQHTAARLLAILILSTACAMAATITVASMSATATAQTSDSNCSQDSAVVANCSSTSATSSAITVASVLGGHLGAFLGADANGFANGFAQVVLGLAVSGTNPQDVLEIDMSLNGVFNNGGGKASLFVDDGNSFSVPLVISCGTGQIILHGIPCLPAGVQQVVIPLDNVDNLTLTMLLQPGLSNAPAFADFLNSADFTIRLPAGATLVNDPGGNLFVTPQASVPEPNLGIGLGSLTLASLIACARRRRNPLN